MSQSKVTSFYVARRSSRIQNSKAATIETAKSLTAVKDVLKSVSQEQTIKDVKKSSEVFPKATEQETNTVTKSKLKNAKLKTAKPGRPKGTKKAPTIDSSQSKVTSFYDTQKALKEPLINTIVEESVKTTSIADCALSNADVSEEIFKTAKSEIHSQEILRSPKRNLSNSNEGTPPHKKSPCLNVSTVKKASPSKLMPTRLFADSPTEKDLDEGTHQKKEAIIPERSEEAKKAVANFKAKLALVRNYEANSFKANSIISPNQRIEKKSVVPTVPAFQKYSYLADPEISSSLILPFKYKLLAEMFRSMDTVISILNNRKEKITFEKVKDGVQQMMKRTFSKIHLGQIMSVMPTAYDVTLEKCTFKKANDPDYQLIITPKIDAAEGSKKNSKKVIMTPQDLSERKQVFRDMLVNIVKQHHKVFLSRLNFPSVPDESIKRWHPKFAVDSVPDIETATLPEVPDSKVCTAKDVLNKFVKSSRNAKIAKALKSVADQSPSSQKKIELEPSPSLSKPPAAKSALKGVCTDLLAKIRARESAKLLESMLESPDETKRKAMLERLPKIIQIVWHYFIAERKAAVPVDTIIEKITHSCSSLSTHEEVKAHLTLITETFPGWLSFIQIPKGLYITINKNKNITEMLDNFQH